MASDSVDSIDGGFVGYDFRPWRQFPEDDNNLHFIEGIDAMWSSCLSGVFMALLKNERSEVAREAVWALKRRADNLKAASGYPGLKLKKKMKIIYGMELIHGAIQNICASGKG